MCGIVGGWVEEGIDDEALNASLDAILHRGPDDFGTFRDPPVALGMRRLAIIDLPGGHQPLSNEDGTVTVVFNGEIYNYRELAEDLLARGHTLSSMSDTEVLVHLYEDEGKAMCKNLRGMYAFAIWDARNRSLFLARDRFGKKPLYYTRTPKGGILFASELKALRPLVKATGGRWDVRQQAIYDYLSLGVVPQPDTVFDGVHTVPPASCLQFDDRQVKFSKYWSIDRRTKQTIPYGQAVEQVRSLVSDAVKIRLRSDVPLGVFLSGGVDSSIIAYEAARCEGQNLRTFTVAMDDRQLDESAVAARTAKFLGVQHTILPLRIAPREAIERVVRQYDQPFADHSAIPTMAVSQLAHEHVTVILNGDGGDELFAGYRRHMAARFGSMLQLFPSGATTLMGAVLGRIANSRRSPLGFLTRLLKGLGLRPGAKYLAWTCDILREEDKRAFWIGDPMRPTEEWVESLIPQGPFNLETQLSGDVGILLLSDLLVKMDIATMASSLEARSPLLDHTLAEFVATLPDSYLLRRGTLKSLLRDAYADHLPREVIKGAKRGFEMPLRSWLKNDLNELLMDTLGSQTAMVRTYLKGSSVDDLIEERILPDRNWATLAYAMLVLELWLREFASTA